MYYNEQISLDNGSDIMFELADKLYSSGVRKIYIDYKNIIKEEFIQKVIEHFKGGEIKIRPPYRDGDSGMVKDEDELKAVRRNIGLLENNGFDVKFVGASRSSAEEIGHFRFLNFSEEMLKYVNTVNSQTVDGRKLSPLEKFMCVYQFVTESANQCEEGFLSGSDLKKQNYVNIVDEGLFNHVGAAMILSEFCNRVGVPCIFAYKKNNMNDYSRAICRVYIDDKEYNCHGLYNADVSKDVKNGMLMQSVNHALLTKKEGEILYGEDFLSYLQNGVVIDNFLDRAVNDPSGLINRSYKVENHGPIIEKLVHSVLEKNEKFIEEFKSKAEPEQNHDLDKNLDFTTLYQYALISNIDSEEPRFKEMFENELLRNILKSPLPVEDFVAEVIDFANRFEVDFYFDFDVDLTLNGVNIEKVKEMVKKTQPVAPSMIYKSLINAYISMGKTEEEAMQMANLIFGSSVVSASEKWNLDESCGNFFQSEVISAKRAEGVGDFSKKKSEDNQPASE